MGMLKANSYQESLQKTASIFKALGHPARLQILQILLLHKNCTCGEIVSLLPLAQSTVSKHLVELKKVNIIAVKELGKKTIYSLIDDNINLSRAFLSNHIELSQKDKIELAKQNKEFKKSNRKANPNLKIYNYDFSHLKISKKS